MKSTVRSAVNTIASAGCLLRTKSCIPGSLDGMSSSSPTSVPAGEGEIVARKIAAAARQYRGVDMAERDLHAWRLIPIASRAMVVYRRKTRESTRNSVHRITRARALGGRDGASLNGHEIVGVLTSREDLSLSGSRETNNKAGWCRVIS
jgi:hypothetical protein